MTQYDEMQSNELGAVVVVLEGYGDRVLAADWGVDEGLLYPVTALDEELSAFFKDQA